MRGSLFPQTLEDDSLFTAGTASGLLTAFGWDCKVVDRYSRSDLTLGSEMHRNTRKCTEQTDLNFLIFVKHSSSSCVLFSSCMLFLCKRARAEHCAAQPYHAPRQHPISPPQYFCSGGIFTRGIPIENMLWSCI